MEKIFIYSEQKRRDVLAGYVQDNIFYKTDGNKLKIPPGWAIDKRVINIIKNKGIKFITCYKEVTVYKVSMEDFLKHSFEINRGHGIQLALPDAFWEQFHKEEIDVERV